MKNLRTVAVAALVLTAFAFQSQAMAFGQLRLAKGLSSAGSGGDTTTESADAAFTEAALAMIFI